MSTDTDDATRDLLVQVVGAATRRRRADDDLRRAVRQAKDAGAEVTELATAASVTRQTIYRWLEGDATARVDVAQVLDEALAALLGHVGENTARELHAGIATDKVDAKVRRYRLGLRNLRSGATADAELRALIGTASEVAAEAERVYGASKRWPSSVVLGRLASS